MTSISCLLNEFQNCFMQIPLFYSEAIHYHWDFPFLKQRQLLIYSEHLQYVRGLRIVLIWTIWPSPHTREVDVIFPPHFTDEEIKVGMAHPSSKWARVNSFFFLLWWACSEENQGEPELRSVKRAWIWVLAFYLLPSVGRTLGKLLNLSELFSCKTEQDCCKDLSASCAMGAQGVGTVVD